MIQKYTRYKILQEFFDFPLRDFHMREIFRRTKITQPSVINHLKSLVKEGLILKEKKGIYPTYRANRDEELFKLYKKSNIILRINQTGLIDYIHDSCYPDVIILFGSASNGDDVEGSDIDVFIQAPEKKLNLLQYLHLMKKIKLDKGFYLNIAFIAGLLIFTYIVFNLSIGWFTIVVPIFAGLIFLAILFLPDEEKKGK